MKSAATCVHSEDIEMSGRNPKNDVFMTTKTKDFIQKICYRKTASIDMTQYGFISDSKIYPVKLLMKPLRANLEKICGVSSGDACKQDKKAVKTKRKRKVVHKTSHSTTRPVRRVPSYASHTGQTPPEAPNSDVSSCTQSYTPLKVRVHTNPNTTTTKKVRLIVPKSTREKK